MKLLIALLLALLLVGNVYAICGIPPIAPIPPIGTSHCDPVCICDETGMNCHWEFQCS